MPTLTSRIAAATVAVLLTIGSLFPVVTVPAAPTSIMLVPVAA